LRPRLPWGSNLILISLWLAWLPIMAAASTGDVAETKTVLLVLGAPGEAQYESNFTHQAILWRNGLRSASSRLVTIGAEQADTTNDHDRLKAFLESEPKEGPAELWAVFLGHGTFDGREARFNLRGPDVSASELAEWLQPFHRPLAVINAASSSAPFLNKLSSSNRVIITATRSGNENNFARFGQYLAQAITSTEADLDKDGQTSSLLEAFLMASRDTSEFYKLAGRLATEHALLDDNGDGAGTPADWFHGLRATKKPKEDSVVDGLLARQWYPRNAATGPELTPDQQTRRNALERAVLLHREKKAQLPADEYYRQLETLLLDLARFYEEASLTRGTNEPPTIASPEKSSVVK
jgi:hypothetical protein